MVRGGFKASPGPIVAAHWRTYVDARGGKVRIGDWLSFGLPPLLVGALCIWRRVELSTSASAGLLTVAGLMSAFLFGVVTQISGRAMDLSDAKPTPGIDTSVHATNLLELSANASYASLTSIAAAVVFVVASVSSHAPWWLRISSGLGLALSVHLAMVLLMVMRREFALTQDRLTRARTGADRPERTLRRRAG